MTQPERPNPDQLLERLREREAREKRAQLKIFLGASAGVGKTYAMLTEAHERRGAGVDVVVGLVETHGRRETEALLQGLKVIPRLALEHRGATLEEFDLDAALALHPQLLLLDELAHTNAPGSRHRRRWQDVEELLGAGIDVYTALNVQHVESLVDVVAQTTGVTVRETVPDSILDRADEIELVDLPPDDLLVRLKEGKVYVPHQAARALEHFFQKGNLIALRELALRQTALRVGAQMETYRRTQGLSQAGGIRERLLVAIGNPVQGVRLVRAARRMAAALNAEWIVAHVELPGRLREDPRVRDHVVDVLGLAEELGAETALLSGLSVADELLAFARERGVVRIMLGKTRTPRWRERLFDSPLSRVLEGSGDIDVFVVRGEEGDRPPAPSPPARPTTGREYLGAVAVVAVCTLLGWAMLSVFDRANISMIYLLGVALSALAFGRRPAILASGLAVAAFDFFFVPPRFTFAVSDGQYVVTFGVMLAVGLLVGTLTARLRDQATSARQREARTRALFRLSRELAERRDTHEMLGVAVERIGDVFESRVAVLLPDGSGRLTVAAGDAMLFGNPEHERGVAQWAFDSQQPAGAGTDTLPGSRGLYLPLKASAGPLGVLAVSPADPRRLQSPDRFQLLQTFANQTALALERTQLAAERERARVDIETERARNALLSSVSHDLRTPLAAITGAASGLRDGATFDAATRRELADTIVDEAQRLNRLVGDLLDLTRLESGALRARKEWHSVEEVVGAALTRLETQIGTHPVDLDLPEDLPLVPLDDVLMEQALFNLIDNAIKYSPGDGAIEITARVAEGWLKLEVADRGPGLPPGEETQIFEKFHRGEPHGERRGVGLGLTICRGIVEAHGGRIAARNRPGGGAVLSLELPLEGEPPRVEPEAPEAATALSTEAARAPSTETEPAPSAEAAPTERNRA
jgi:two-component system sensor histidine kinase KdpD